MATKTPVVEFTVTVCQYALVGKTRWVHVMPFVDEAAMVERF
jgi:hypothetical protein